MRIFMAVLCLLASGCGAEAASKQNWYLRIDNGRGGEAFVFKSKAACEAAGKRMVKAQKEIDKMSQKYASNYRRSNPRCLDRLPHGYLPPS
jgi:hypothetical protein